PGPGARAQGIRTADVARPLGRSSGHRLGQPDVRAPPRAVGGDRRLGASYRPIGTDSRSGPPDVPRYTLTVWLSIQSISLPSGTAVAAARPGPTSAGSTPS